MQATGMVSLFQSGFSPITKNFGRIFLGQEIDQFISHSDDCIQDVLQVLSLSHFHLQIPVM